MRAISVNSALTDALGYSVKILSLRLRYMSEERDDSHNASLDDGSGRRDFITLLAESTSLRGMNLSTWRSSPDSRYTPWSVAAKSVSPWSRRLLTGKFMLFFTIGTISLPPEGRRNTPSPLDMYTVPSRPDVMSVTRFRLSRSPGMVYFFTLTPS